MPKILNIGSLNIDYVYHVPHFLRPGETLPATKRAVFPGGKGLNQSVALARAGAATWHAGKIGADGALLETMLREAGVDTRYLDKTGDTSGHTIIQVDAAGQNCILLFGGANQQQDVKKLKAVITQFDKGDIMVLQNEVNALSEIMRAASQQGLLIAFNPSPWNDDINSYPLETVRWFLLNEIEGQGITGCTEPKAILDELGRRFPGAAVILTLGEKGAVYRDANETFTQPSHSVPVADTTAAGDTFTGFFLAATAAGHAPQQAMALAASAAAIAVSRPGAAVSIPRLSEAEAFEKA